MSANNSYPIMYKDKEKRTIIDSIMARDEKNYKQTALLDALISREFGCDSELLRKLLKKLDVQINYVIPARPIFKLDKPLYRSGNTILHVAREMHELHTCKTLVQFGGDFTMKNRDGVPLLCLENQDEYSNHFDFKNNYQTSDRDFEDTVLSAHMQYQIIDNPSDPNGFSHFHVACMYNKVEIVQFFLANGISPNEAVNKDSSIYPGYTPLHFAAKYGAVETVELLLKSGADPCMKNSKGLNPMNLLIDEKLNTWTQITRRIRVKADFDKFCYSNLRNFHMNLERIIFVLLPEKTSDCGFDFYDDAGLSYFHIICTMQDSSFVEEYLKSNVNINLERAVSSNSVLWPGYTALHFAAHFNIHTVKLLLKKGANLGAKDAKGMTPFDICLIGMKAKHLHSIYSLYPPWADIQFSDGKTKLSNFISAMRDSDVFKDFMMKNVEDVNIYIPFDSPVCAGYTPLHLNVICSEIPRNWNPENADYFFTCLEKLSQKMRIYYCMGKNANICAEDARGTTPIHLAIKLQERHVIYDLFIFHEKIYNVVDEQGLTHLHAACAGKLEKIVTKLLAGGVNVNEPTKTSYIWYKKLNTSGFDNRDVNLSFVRGSTALHIATIVESSRIVELLINCNADVLAKDNDNMTPLERSIGTSIFGDNRVPKWKLKHELLSNEKKQIMELLTLRVSELIVDTRPDQMLYCYSLLKDEILSRLFKRDHEPTRRILESAGITRLHVACFTKNLEEVEDQFENGSDCVNARVDSTSPLWADCTPLHILMKHNEYERINDSEEHIEITDLLLDYGADVTAINAKDNTPLHQIFQSYLHHKRNVIYIDMLLYHTKNFNVNPVNAKGLSHLHAACVTNNVPIIEILLEHGAEINQAVDYFDHGFGGFTAMHFAAAYQSQEAIDVLLRYGADIHCKTVFDDTVLHSATREKRRPCVALLRKLISAGADINVRNALGDRPLEKLIRSNAIENKEVILFLENGCRVNVWNPMTEEGCLAIALRKNETQPIFKTILRACDIKSIDEKGRNAIHNIVSFKRPAWTEFEDNPIEGLFISIKDYTTAIETLTKLGLNIDLQDLEGSTPLHVAAQLQNITGIVGLLNNGANVNIADSNGKSAFAYSLELSKLHDQVEGLDRKILEIVVGHLHKLNSIGFKLSESNVTIWREIANTIALEHIWFQECSIEWHKMYYCKIGVGLITLGNFLSDTGAISYYPRMSSNNRKAIDSIFKDRSEELRNEFPKYAGLLLMQHRKAVTRVHLVSLAEASIDFLVGFHMPVVCSDIILRYLSNDELNNLIASMDVCI